MTFRALRLAGGATLLAAALWGASPGVAAAQVPPQMQVEIDETTIGVGDTVHIEMSATSADTMPTDAKLGKTPGLLLRAQNESPSQTHISINGSRSDRYTLTVDWMLQAQRPGTFAVGPPSVVVGTTRFAGQQPITIRVLPQGQAPRHARPQGPQSPFGMSPFDPWKSLFPGGMDPFDTQPPPTAPLAAVDPKLALPATRGDAYFLHATVDKTTAVVGEQVTFNVYEYVDNDVGSVEISNDARDASVADFVKHPLLREDQDAVLVGFASIAGRIWQVKLVRRWALFPLRAGDLVIGPMSETLVRPRAVSGQPRTTETLHVQVGEPPVAGRPPGYSVGDVGRFALAATVDPRAVEQGGAVGVHVEISGTGNLPGSLPTGAREGVEWLTPEVHDTLGATAKDTYGGKRTFDYVVRIRKTGNVDLGDLTVPFWDPERKRYDVARAALGTVKVTPSAQAAPADTAEPILAGLPGPRDALDGAPVTRRHADDSPFFWLIGLFAGPFAFGLAVAGRRIGRRLAGAWRGRRASPAADLKERMAQAQAACGRGDPRGADAAIARALEAATIVHAGVSVRAAVGGEVAAQLERAGVARDCATGVADLLRECEAARFAPDAADVVAVRARWARAQGAIRELEKRG